MTRRKCPESRRTVLVKASEQDALNIVIMGCPRFPFNSAYLALIKATKGGTTGRVERGVVGEPMI